MNIIDINGKKRTIKDNLKIITDTRTNHVGRISHENIDGELVAINNDHVVEVEEKFVEATIVGENRVWKEWYPLKEFEELNPNINI